MYEVYIISPEGYEYPLTTFPREDLAEDFCREYGWEWEDENGFIWDMDYREAAQ